MSNNPEERRAGFNQGVRACIAWLHAEADKMNDQHAKGVLNNAAFHLGVNKPDIKLSHTDEAEWLRQALEEARDALHDAWQRTGHADDLAAHHIADLALNPPKEPTDGR